MKDYMLFYKGGDPDWMEKQSEEQMATAMSNWANWLEKLQQNENLISGGSPLQYSGKRLTQDGVVTDISASEFKELVSGYTIIRTNSMDEAVEIARGCPIFNYPNIKTEIREVVDMG